MIKIFFISMFRDAASYCLFFGNVSFSFREKGNFFRVRKGGRENCRDRARRTPGAGRGVMFRPEENMWCAPGGRDAGEGGRAVGDRHPVGSAFFWGGAARSQARQSLQGLEAVSSGSCRGTDAVTCWCAAFSERIQEHCARRASSVPWQGKHGCKMRSRRHV